MDLHLYLQVLWRFRLLVLTGLILALSLAFLSFVRVDFQGGSPSVTYREAERWQSTARLFVTQQGFPWGSTVPDYVPSDPDSGTPPIPVADQGRLSSLAVLYAQLATSDPVVRLIGERKELEEGNIEVNPVPAPAYSTPAILPLIEIKTLAPSPGRAVQLARKTTDAMLDYLRRQQQSAGIAPEERVLVEVIKSPDEAKLVDRRGKTLPVVVFSAVMIACIGLAFILENLRPRVKLLTRRDPLPPPLDVSRRSA
jgi:hypothetical protein